MRVDANASIVESSKIHVKVNALAPEMMVTGHVGQMVGVLSDFFSM